MELQDVNKMTEPEKQSMLSVLKSKRTSILISGIIGYLLLNVIRSSSGIILPSVIDKYGLTAAQAGLFSAIFNYTYAAVSIPIGGMIDIFKARKIMLISYGAMIVGLVVFAYSPNYSMLLISRGLMGFGSAGFFPAFTKVVSNWAASRDFPKYSGLYMSAASLGTVLSATPLVLLINGCGMKNSHLVLAGCCVAIFVVMLIVMRTDPAECGLIQQDILEGNEIPQTKEFKNGLQGVLTVIRQPRVWCIVCAVLVSNIGGVQQQYASTYMIKGLGFAELTSSNLIMIGSIVAIAGGLLQAWISTKYSVKASMITFMSMIIVSVALHAFFLSQFTPALMLVAMLPQRLAGGMAIATCQSMFRKNVTSKYYGTCVGLYNAIGWAVGSGIFVQVFAGFIDESYSIGSFQTAFKVTLVVCLVFAAIGMLSKEEVIPAFAANNNEEANA